MRLIIEPDYAKVSEWAANYVASRINEANPTAEKPFAEVWQFEVKFFLKIIGLQFGKVNFLFVSL